MRVYFSASPSVQDLALLKELLSHLAPVTRAEAELSSVLDVVSGGDERTERLQWLAGADVIALLISADYCASDRCQEEAREALSHRSRRGAAVVPVLLRPSTAWHEEPYGRLFPLPSDGCAVTLWRSRDEALSTVAAGLRAVVRSQRTQSRPSTGSAGFPPPAAAYDPRHYVTRPREERSVHNRLAWAGAAVALQGPWGFGKATLVSHLLAKLPSTARAVRLDLGALSQVPGDQAAFTRWVGERLLAALLPEQPDLLERSFRRPGTNEARLAWLLEEHLLPGAAPLYLCLERADRLHGQDYTFEFFAMLRGWVEASKQSEPWTNLRLLLTVASEPQYLDSTDHSGLFRDATALELPPLTQEQLVQMARSYGFDSDVAGMERVWLRTGGYPFLARLWLYEAAMREVPLSQLSEQEVFASHLRGVHRYLKEERLLPALRQVLRGDVSESDAYLKLYSRGLIYQQGGVYRLRNPLYQEFAEALCPSR